MTEVTFKTFDMVLGSSLITDPEAADEIASALGPLFKPRPIAEYHEDMGTVLWWAEEQRKCIRCDGYGSVGLHANLPDVKCIPCDGKGAVGTGQWMGEAPYVGSPNDIGFEVMIDPQLRVHTLAGQIAVPDSEPLRFNVGGWPCYHTHFTPIPIPRVPNAPPSTT